MSFQPLLVFFVDQFVNDMVRCSQVSHHSGELNALVWTQRTDVVNGNDVLESVGVVADGEVLSDVVVGDNLLAVWTRADQTRVNVFNF